MRDVIVSDGTVCFSDCSVFTLTYPGKDVQVEQSRIAKEAVPEFRDGRSDILTLQTMGNEHIGMGPFLSSIVVFDFGESLMQTFGELVDACRTEPSFSKIEALDSKMASDHGLSAFHTPLLLELLVYVANTMQNWPALENLIEQGSPAKLPPRDKTKIDSPDPIAACRTLHNILMSTRGAAGHKSWFVVARMLRGGWLIPDSHYARCVYTIPSDTSADNNGDGKGEQKAAALFDALVATGYLPSMRDSSRPKVALLVWLTACITSPVPISLLRHIGEAIPFATSVDKPAELLHAAVSDRTARSRDVEGTRELLAFLVDEQRLNINGTAQRSELRLAAGTARWQESALHAAVWAANVPALQWLLERGAKVVKDGEGKTPFERAVLLNRYRVVRFFADYYEERKMEFSYTYEEPKQPEDWTGSQVDWRSNLGLLRNAAPPSTGEDDHGDWVPV